MAICSVCHSDMPFQVGVSSFVIFEYEFSTQRHRDAEFFYLTINKLNPLCLCASVLKES